MLADYLGRVNHPSSDFNRGSLGNDSTYFRPKSRGGKGYFNQNLPNSPVIRTPE